MKENFITSMLSEGGKISHKRFISVIVTFVICFISTYGAIKYQQYFTGILYSLLMFVAVMSGIATVAQIVSLVRGTPAPKEDDSPKQ